MITHRLHWASIRGRARADAWPLLLCAAVVALVSMLGAAVPGLLRATADQAVREAIRNAGDNADVTVRANWPPDWGQTGRERAPFLSEDLDSFRDRALTDLGSDLRTVLNPPVTTAVSTTLNVTDGSVLRTFQVAYLDRGSGPAVTWTSGKAPGPTNQQDRFLTVPYEGPPWPVQVGLSETVAEVMGAKPGDRLSLKDEQKNPKDVRVSGIFRPDDPADPAWRLAPWLLEPINRAGAAGYTRFGGLLSAESLPDARLAFDDDNFHRAVSFTPDPEVVTWEAARELAASAVALKAASATSGEMDAEPAWNTQLDAVLRDVARQVDAASAQASVLLTAVLTGAVLVLLLAADLLVRRRTAALAIARQRGTGLPTLSAELLLESTVVAVGGALVGVAFARTVVSAVTWTWVLPVVIAAALAAPALGVLAAARATRDRRAPANRAARRWARHTELLRRAAAEIAVVAAAAAAFVTLHQRGVVPAIPGQIDSGAGLPASAPTLGVLVGALVLLRLLPWGTQIALRAALRSTRPLAVFGAAQAAATSRRALPVLALVTSAALASFALTVHSTVESGLADGAWHTVGADARLDAALNGSSAGTSDADEAFAGLAQQLAAAPGVRHAVAGLVTSTERIVTDDTTVSPILVVVDTAAFRQLLADTPLPALAPLGASGDGAVPALVRSGDGTLRPGIGLDLLREANKSIRLTAVGTAPPVGGATDVVLVDAAALTAAGVETTPNTVWVTGPGAERAVTGVKVPSNAVVRADVLQARRDSPLVAGLLTLAWAAAATLLALGLLGLALGAAAGAPGRWETLTRLRTLGLRPRDARRVAAGEVVPVVAVAAVAGPLFGLLLAHLTFGPLVLRMLTGQAGEPDLTPPWLPLAAVTASFLVAVAVVVPVESALRRRSRLSETLRVGG
ncbi:FtsX-like permease family protein [Actinoplanes sp. GCM10030250]|uniref:FtsX-like permease family protein n=1 Tax=Actinoplanes sp. GCM10030250 TaxID=3273376 RepID=UPI00361175B1